MTEPHNRRRTDKLIPILLALLVVFMLVSATAAVVALKNSHDIRVADQRDKLQGCQGGALIIATYLFDKAADAEKISELSTTPAIRDYFANQVSDLRKRGRAYADPKACDHPKNLPAISPNQPQYAP